MFSTVRCVQGAPVTLTYQPVDADGEAVSSDPGVVTVTVARADGTVVVTGAATAGVGTAPRTYTLTATVTATLDELSVTWRVGAVDVHRTTVAVVGRPYLPVTGYAGEPFGIVNYEPTLADTITYPSATLVRCRNEVEQLVERACGHAISFVPRFSVAHPTPKGDLVVLPHSRVRAVRWASYTDAGGTVTSVDVTGVEKSSGRSVRLLSGWWPMRRLTVGYEHGMDAPPDDLNAAVARAVRRQATIHKSALDSRAISHTMPTGEIQRFPIPGLGQWVTGIPEVDEVLMSYRARFVLPGFA